MKTLGTMLIILVAATCVSQAKDGAPVSAVFQPGEELRYKVQWKFFRLGTIVIRTVQDSTCTDPAEVKVAMTVQSNPDLPFIWIREYNESLLDAVSVTSRAFRARHRNGNDYCAIRQVRDDARNIMVYNRTDLNTGAIERNDTVHNVGRYVEGPSLFAFARVISRETGSRSVATVIDGTICSTYFTPGRETDDVTIDALEQPVRVRVLSGIADWTGGSSAGVSGEFRGWMSDDDAAIPVKAEMKILLGSITLELESWTRSGWVPPVPHSSSR